MITMRFTSHMKRKSQASSSSPRVVEVHQIFLATGCFFKNFHFIHAILLFLDKIIFNGFHEFIFVFTSIHILCTTLWSLFVLMPFFLSSYERACRFSTQNVYKFEFNIDNVHMMIVIMFKCEKAFSYM